jgi:hypothetical protein
MEHDGRPTQKVVTNRWFASCDLWRNIQKSAFVPGANGFPIAFMENLDGSPFLPMCHDVPWCALDP